jgi:metal-responsive CopG/Arc/MetJ family transcriptional regulator
MGKTKIAITLDQKVVKKIDVLVRNRVYPNRSRAIEEALEDKLDRIEQRRLARECAKLDPTFEKAMAEDGMSAELSEWPEY